MEPLLEDDAATPTPYNVTFGSKVPAVPPCEDLTNASPARKVGVLASMLRHLRCCNRSAAQQISYRHPIEEVAEALRLPNCLTALREADRVTQDILPDAHTQLHRQRLHRLTDTRHGSEVTQYSCHE